LQEVAICKEIVYNHIQMNHKPHTTDIYGKFLENVPLSVQPTLKEHQNDFYDLFYGDNNLEKDTDSEILEFLNTYSQKFSDFLDHQEVIIDIHAAQSCKELLTFFDSDDSYVFNTAYSRIENMPDSKEKSDSLLNVLYSFRYPQVLVNLLWDCKDLRVVSEWQVPLS
jgi:hypothetical protein